MEVARKLPNDGRDEIAWATLQFAASDGEPVDAAHLSAILKGLMQAKRGQFAGDAEIEAAFRRFEIGSAG